MGIFDFLNPASPFRTPGRVSREPYEEAVTVVPGEDENESDSGEGFRGHGATGDLPFPGPSVFAPWLRALPGQIARGARFAGNIGQGALAARGLADFPDFPESSEIPTDLPAARPGAVNALPPSANSFEEQVRASMFGGAKALPPIPMRTADSPQMPIGDGLKPEPKMRAIRLPNGQFLYTNRPETGGEEFSTADAGLIGRSSVGEIGTADNRGRPQLDPASDTAKALVQRASQAAERGTTVPGRPYNPSGGASMLEGTPEQQRGIALDEAIGATDLARAQSAREFAELPIERQAMVNNPDLVAGAAVTKQMQKQIGQARQEAELAAQELSTPGHPKFIQDEAARRLALRDLEARRDNAVQDALAVGSLMMGRSVPQR